MPNTISNYRTTDLTEQASAIIARVACLNPGQPTSQPRKAVEWTSSASLSTPVTVNDWFAEFAPDADRVREFCLKHDIMREAHFAAYFARNVFPSGSKIGLTIQSDPESDDEWLLVTVESPPGSELLSCFNRFINVWHGHVSIAATSLIRLTCTFA